MQTGKSKLLIHTTIPQPESSTEQVTPRRIRLNWRRRVKPSTNMNEGKPSQAKKKFAVRRKSKPKPKPDVGVASAKRKMRPQLTASEKLLRNSAVACALLLTVMALQNVNHPFTQTATEKIRQVVTMRIDLDESLGRLNFVRGLVPDAALVFWNMGSSDKQPPVDGTVAHEYAQMQPWIEYVCGPQQPVVAVESGTVAAVGQGAQGDWTLMLDHEDGVQTVYAYLAQALVKVGQTVEKGEQIGLTQDQQASRLYFELRRNGVPQDPSSQP